MYFKCLLLNLKLHKSVEVCIMYCWHNYISQVAVIQQYSLILNWATLFHLTAPWLHHTVSLRTKCFNADFSVPNGKPLLKFEKIFSIKDLAANSPDPLHVTLPPFGVPVNWAPKQSLMPFSSEKNLDNCPVKNAL